METKKYTLWEHWTKKDQVVESKLEDKITNVLKLHLGDFVLKKVSGGRQTFEVVEIIEYDRLILREHFFFSDYLLKDGDNTVVLRAVPKERGFDILWLNIFFESEFDSSIQDAAKCKIFKIDQNNGGVPDIQYDSLNAGEDGFLADQRIVSKTGIKDEQARYWDFTRQIDEGAEFFFVEINEETGYIMMFKGLEISINDIEIIPK